MNWAEPAANYTCIREFRSELLSSYHKQEAIKASPLKETDEFFDTISCLTYGILEQLSEATQMQQSLKKIFNRDDFTSTDACLADLLDQDLRYDRATLKILNATSCVDLRILQIIANTILPRIDNESKFFKEKGIDSRVLLARFNSDDLAAITFGTGIHMLQSEDTSLKRSARL